MTCNCKNYIVRTEDNISKGCRSLNAATALGIRKGGLTIYSCNIIYWCMIVPISTYGCELWILKQNDIESLDKFQRYAGRRIQRFPPHSPNEASFRGLGWMRIENFIYGKKLIFIRTILIMDDSIYKSVLKIRAIRFNENIRAGMINEGDSPIFDWLRISIIFGLYEVVMNMIINSHMYSKEGWKKLVWGRAWEVEDNDWDITCSFHKSLTDLNLTLGGAKYLVWYQISDKIPKYVMQCENMAKMVCKASELKSDDRKFKQSTFAMKCSLCNHAAYEDAKHMIMSCHGQSMLRNPMFTVLENNAECREV